MKPLIWKELRELAFWVGGIAVVLAIAGAFGIYSNLWLNPNMSGNDPYRIESAYNFLKVWMQLGAPFAALLLGWLQIIRERSGDQWAFLIHRPVSPRIIFFAKVVSGLGSYFVATVLPLAGITMWLMAPGRLPGPFSPVLALPCLAAILAGVPFYFAAMLVALRPARWWGSKLLPIACVLVGAVISSQSFSFVQALFPIAPLIVMTSLAALGSFVSGGEYALQTRWQRIGLSATLLVGSLAFVLAVGATVQNFMPTDRHSSTGMVELAVTKQGQLVQVERSPMRDILHVFDASGNPIRNASLNQDDYDVENPGQSASLGDGPIVGSTSYQSYSAFFGYVEGDNYHSAYYDRANSVIDVYATGNGGLAGFLGTRGSLAPSADAAGRFPYDLSSTSSAFPGGSSTLLLFPNALYRVDTHSQTLTVFALPQGAARFDSVVSLYAGSRRTANGPDDEDLTSYVAAISGGFITIYGPSGSVVARVPLAASSVDYPYIQFWARATPLRFYMLYESSIEASDSTVVRPCRFVAVDPPGTVVSSAAVIPVRARTTIPISINSLLTAICMPLAIDGWFKAQIACYAAFDFGPYRKALSHVLHDPVEGARLLFECVGALIFVLVMLALSRPYGWNRRDTIKWMIGGALLSWPGILMLLAMVPLPMRIECPSCRQKRLASRTTCEHCGAATQPGRDGTEIFESDNSDQRHSAVTR